MSAENEETAGNFAIETISVLLTEDVEVTIKNIKALR